MRKKRGPEATKSWVPLLDHAAAHGFDQTNGLVRPEDVAERRGGLSDEERSAAAAVISGGFSAKM